jgi:2-polyprenyl-3-methyl-5-hydroxy-6-metoxy-1,4-benzoquinol methylase
MGDGRGDLQRVWHEFVGARLLPAAPIDVLDVGAGLGVSKARLAQGRHRVTTHDVNRANMANVDVIADLGALAMSRVSRYDAVTAFDVIEHAPAPPLFLAHLAVLARRLVFFSTPNHAAYPHPWHFTAGEVQALAQAIPHAEIRYFRRDKTGEHDEVTEVSGEAFVVDEPRAYAFGVAIYVEAAR